MLNIATSQLLGPALGCQLGSRLIKKKKAKSNYKCEPLIDGINGYDTAAYELSWPSSHPFFLAFIFFQWGLFFSQFLKPCWRMKNSGLLAKADTTSLSVASSVAHI